MPAKQASDFITPPLSASRSICNKIGIDCPEISDVVNGARDCQADCGLSQAPSNLDEFLSGGLIVGLWVVLAGGVLLFSCWI